MTTVTILPIATEQGATTYVAVAGGRQSAGRTAGEALDAITSQFDRDELGTVVVIQHHRPDRFFTADQQQRLEREQIPHVPERVVRQARSGDAPSVRAI